MGVNECEAMASPIVKYFPTETTLYGTFSVPFNNA